MPYSKRDQAAWMRAYRARKKAARTVLLPKALARRLRAQGIDVERQLKAVPVSLDDYRGLERRLKAKMARIGWQTAAILSLRGELLLERQRITQLEGDVARLEAMMDSVVAEETADG